MRATAQRSRCTRLSYQVPRSGLSKIAVIVAGAAIAGCSGNGDSANLASSGIRGAVVIGPTCAVQRVGQRCADEPYATELRIVDLKNDEQVATVTSDANGRFEVALAPGQYRIEPASSRSPPSAAPVDVEVAAQRYAAIRIHFDSGIR
jgi:hypothetical protein